MFGVIFVFCFLPETKGKSLEEIEEMFAKKKQEEDSAWYDKHALEYLCYFYLFPEFIYALKVTIQ